MKSKNLSEKILRSIKTRGFKYITLDPVLETKYILQRSGENFKKFLFSFSPRLHLTHNRLHGDIQLAPIETTTKTDSFQNIDYYSHRSQLFVKTKKEYPMLDTPFFYGQFSFQGLFQNHHLSGF